MKCIKIFGYHLSVGRKTNAEGRQQSYLGSLIRASDIKSFDNVVEKPCSKSDYLFV